MPYKISKLKNNLYQVKNMSNNKIVAKGTSFLKARNQIKLLNMIDRKKNKNKKN
tara:strand:- start:1130 stop:1291 length:162 start_codon:yes stop_codon:yes gene_type:complete